MVCDLLPGVPEFEQGERVLASGTLLGIMEVPPMRFLRSRCCDDGEAPVGKYFKLNHRRPSLPGAVLTVVATCTDFAGPDVTFNVEVYDHAGTCVASGVVVQSVVEVDHFRRRISPAPARAPGAAPALLQAVPA